MTPSTNPQQPEPEIPFRGRPQNGNAPLLQQPEPCDLLYCCNGTKPRWHNKPQPSLPTKVSVTPGQQPEQIKDFTPNDSDLCKDCGYGEWRHSKPGHMCPKFVGQQPVDDEPVFDELELQIGTALVLVRREATKQWLMEVIQPGDEQWHMHDMTQEVMSIKRLITTYADRRADKRVEDELQTLCEVIGEDEEPDFNPGYATWGDTDHDHSAVVYGRNEARNEIKTMIAKEIEAL